VDSDGMESFLVWAESAQDRLRYALVAGYGKERGLEAANVALSYAWEHWDRISSMSNPVGYVYRVGQREASRARRSDPVVFPAASSDMPWVEPGLPAALEKLSDRQRVVVTLVHGFGHSHTEVADVLGVSTGSVQRHLERGLRKLRDSLGVHVDV